MTDLPEKKKRGRPIGATTYPQQVIDQALLAMALTRQAKGAYDQLKLAGVTPLPAQSTIRRWRHEFAGRLAELTEKHGAEIDRHVVSGFLDVMADAQEVELLLLEKLKTAAERDEIPARDLAGAMRNATTTKGINFDKVMLIQGRPTQIVGKEKDATEALNTLAERFRSDVDSTVESPRELEDGS